MELNKYKRQKLVGDFGDFKINQDDFLGTLDEK